MAWNIRRTPRRARWRLLGFVLAVAAPSAAIGKPRTIDLKSELARAGAIRWVRVLAYGRDGLHLEPIPPVGASIVARYDEDESWIAVPAGSEYGQREPLTALWPPVGSDVLVVLTRGCVVSLFGRREKADVRFWSPRMTGSVALFECRGPAKSLVQANGKSDVTTSWDGCRLPVEALQVR